jgi:hypothetical protein
MTTQGHGKWSARLVRDGGATSFDVVLTATNAESANKEAKERATAAEAEVVAIMYREVGP